MASHSGRFYILEISSFQEESADKLTDGNSPSPMNGTVRVFKYPEDKVLTICRSCALHGRILTLRQDPTHLYYRAIFPSIKQGLDTADSTVELIQDYFNLSVNLAGLYEKWSSRDSHFKETAPKFVGIRMLRQDPWENLISFICSSNNNIIRISQMVPLPLHAAPFAAGIVDQY